MLVNFGEISEIATLVYEFGQVLIINGFLVDADTYPTFVSSRYDA